VVVGAVVMRALHQSRSQARRAGHRPPQSRIVGHDVGQRQALKTHSAVPDRSDRASIASLPLRARFVPGPRRLPRWQDVPGTASSAYLSGAGASRAPNRKLTRAVNM
jgi:hypothetical protein